MSRIFIAAGLILYFLFIMINGNNVKPNLRVLNGTAAKNGMFPYVVFVAFLNRSCTGSIITASNVLTAAHCYMEFPEGSTNKDMFIGACIAGEVYINKPKPDAIVGLQMRHVAKFIMHPNFTVGDKFDIRFDFSVLTMDEPFTLTEYVRTIPLATHDLSEGQSCITVGFGDQIFNYTEAVEADLAWFETTVTEADCVGPGSTCTATPSKAAYYGDSGGPLIDKLDHPAIYGALSYMRILGNPTAGVIYSGVHANKDWIIENSDLAKHRKHKRSGGERIREYPLVLFSTIQLLSDLCKVF